MSHALPSVDKRKIEPITGVARMYIDQVKTETVNEDVIEQAMESIRGLLNGLTTYFAAKEECQRLIGSSLPVDRIKSIIDLAWGRCDDENNLPQTPSTMSKRCRVWTAKDDIRLLAAIYRFGLGDWKNIAEFVGNGKSRSQCSQRWSRALNPCIIKETWSQDDDEKLKLIIQTRGTHNWSKISQEMVTRSDVQCRYRYMQLTKGSGTHSEVHMPFVANYKAHSSSPVDMRLYGVCESTQSAISNPEEDTPQSSSIFSPDLFKGSLADLIPPLKLKQTPVLTTSNLLPPLNLPQWNPEKPIYVV